jgi:hypothetical protein
MRQLLLRGCLIPLIAVGATMSCAQSGHLEFVDRVRMVNCDPSVTKPCFRMKFNVVDDHGSPLGLDLSNSKTLPSQVVVNVDNEKIQPFFVSAEGGNTKTERGRITLIIVDISGSMNHKLSTGKTRFQTAQDALEQSLEGFDPSVDRIAIVPFESHNVEQQIAGAVFARSKEAAIAQIESLTVPQAKNNTALYSAVAFGLHALAKEASSSVSTNPETLMVVMTDGKNEVLKGDDDGLLDGPSGLQQAARAVQTSGTDVIGVGFGDEGLVDESALRQISTKTYMAANV